MDAHFRAFSFVDRIHSVQPGTNIRGDYVIPDGLAAFPVSLAGEAVGQLAAWAAMAAFDFKRRPVAGLAATIELFGPLRPGQRLELAAELETLDGEAAAYGGTAQVDGVPVIRLQHCVGPMLTADEFDDPAALRERFTLLRGDGAVPGAFGGLPSVALNRAEGEPGQSLESTLQVPMAAPFFGDHFPRRPVFPGTLLMHANLELAATLARDLPPPAGGGRWITRRLSDVKLRAFTPPGETLAITARVIQLASESAILGVETRKGRKIVSTARVLFLPDSPS